MSIVKKPGFLKLRGIPVMPGVKLANKNRERIQQRDPLHLDAETIRPVRPVIHPWQGFAILLLLESQMI
jgi:hypothetical protein